MLGLIEGALVRAGTGSVLVSPTVMLSVRWKLSVRGKL